MEGGYETAPKLSNGTSLNDLQWSFQGHDYSTSNNLKIAQHIQQLYLQWPTNRKSYIIYRTAPFSMTLKMTLLKVTPFFDAEYLRIGTTYRHSFNEILIGTYTRPTQQCHFEWPGVTLSQNIQWHEASRGLSATAELLVLFCCHVLFVVLIYCLGFILCRPLKDKIKFTIVNNII